MKKGAPWRSFFGSGPVWPRLLRSPAAIHVPGHAAHVGGSGRAEEHSQLAKLLGRGELHRGFLFAQQQLLGLFVADAVLLGISNEERSEEHTSELQSPCNLVCRLLLEKKKKIISQSNLISKLELYQQCSLQSISYA